MPWLFHFFINYDLIHAGFHEELFLYDFYRKHYT
jgi:hypothetical protein